MVEVVVFFVCAAIVLAGGVGVILAQNPVHSALFLIQTLFGVAVLFVSLEAHFLAAVQVIVYAGAIVILFLFVIMFLGVDREEPVTFEPVFLLAAIPGGAIFVLVVAALTTDDPITGAPGLTGQLVEQQPGRNLNTLAETLFTDYVFAFEATAILLTIAVVGAVVLARRVTGEFLPAGPTTPEVREARMQARIDARVAELEAEAAATGEPADAGEAAEAGGAGELAEGEA